MLSCQKKFADAIRVLSMDAVQRAHSGHPGMPMGMADIATVLWRNFLRHNPGNPDWFNRDRFILSNGHGSLLHYALLHLTGYALSLDDIQHFRQLHSKTPGHPEYKVTPGIETTTGPLGQGFAHAVGMAVAERSLAAYFNRPGHELVDHFTYVFLGDGCLMEGISHEVASLAGCLGLGKLIAFWDNNKVSIDGDIIGWFTDNTPQRFTAYHWHVIPEVDGHDPEAIETAIQQARAVIHQPSLICCRTQIAFGAPTLGGKAAAHGAPLGVEEVAATRQKLNWHYPAFTIPDEIYKAWDARPKGAELERNWEDQWRLYQKDYPQLAREFDRRIHARLPDDWPEKSRTIISELAKQSEKMATRKASQDSLNAFGPLLPELLGGSADLSESNLTVWKGVTVLSRENPSGSYLYYGVREFGMSAMMTGIARHGGFIPYGGTFLVFSDYARNAIRVAAMMEQRVIFVYTHDSIGLGEDGPTHQPIEHINSLRMIPKLAVWRPCDAVETAIAWQQALSHTGPSCLLLSRQILAAQIHASTRVPLIERGGYILLDCKMTPDAIIIATGSEVGLAVDAAHTLAHQGRQIRVVSMPSTDRFALQDPSYQDAVLPPAVLRRVAIEAGNPDYWYRYVGSSGKIIGIDQFGASAPGQVVLTAFGFTVEHVVNTVNSLL